MIVHMFKSGFEPEHQSHGRFGTGVLNGRRRASQMLPVPMSSRTGTHIKIRRGLNPSGFKSIILRCPGAEGAVKPPLADVESGKYDPSDSRN
jgi:hypothetical protein